MLSYCSFLNADMSYETQANGMNPLDPAQPLNSPPDVQTIDRAAHPQNIVLDEDSAVTKAEKLERHGGQDDFPEPVAKRIKVVASADEEASGNGESRSERRKGVAPIKPESVLLNEYVSTKCSQLSDFWSTLFQSLRYLRRSCSNLHFSPY